MPSTAENAQNCIDSSEVCHIQLSGVRKHTSIRCDSTVWNAFKLLCRANGLSTCDILEKLLIGVTVGLQISVAHPTTIQVVVDAPRIVKRVRRRQLIFEDEINTIGPEKETKPICDLCGKDAVSLFRTVKGSIQKRACAYHANTMKTHPLWIEVASYGKS